MAPWLVIHFSLMLQLLGTGTVFCLHVLAYCIQHCRVRGRGKKKPIQLEVILVGRKGWMKWNTVK